MRFEEVKIFCTAILKSKNETDRSTGRRKFNCLFIYVWTWGSSLKLSLSHSCFYVLAYFESRSHNSYWPSVTHPTKVRGSYYTRVFLNQCFLTPIFSLICIIAQTFPTYAYTIHTLPFSQNAAVQTKEHLKKLAYLLNCIWQKAISWSEGWAFDPDDHPYIRTLYYL